MTEIGLAMFLDKVARNPDGCVFSCFAFIPASAVCYFLISAAVMDELDSALCFIGCLLTIAVVFMINNSPIRPLAYVGFFGLWTFTFAYPLLGNIMNRRGLKQMDLDDLQTALQQTRLRPNDPLALSRLAAALNRVGLIPSAVVLQEKVVSMSPPAIKNTETAHLRSYSWRMNNAPLPPHLVCGSCRNTVALDQIFCPKCQADHLYLAAGGKAISGDDAKKRKTLAVWGILGFLIFAFSILPTFSREVVLIGVPVLVLLGAAGVWRVLKA